MKYFNKIINISVMLDIRSRLRLKVVVQQTSLINFLRRLVCITLNAIGSQRIYLVDPRSTNKRSPIPIPQ